METPAAPPVSFPEPRLIPVRRVTFSPPEKLEAQPPAEPGPAAEAAAEKASELIAEQRQHLQPGKLMVRIDEQAGRFVQTLTDASTMEVVWRYPNEAQLAFSRAIKAYMRVVSGS